MKDLFELETNLAIKKTTRSINNLLTKKWLIVVIALMLTGLGAALTGVLFTTGIQLLDNWRLNLLNEIPPWFLLPVIGGIGGFSSSYLISKLSPSASGSGVSHIMAFMRHRSVPMGLRVGMVKLIGGIIAIGSGFPLGPEGPAVQMGGSVAWKMAQILKAPVAFRRVIVAAGGGAGLAAIFNAPIGGFVYVIEELLNSVRPVVLLLVVVTTFWADTWADVLQAIGLNSTSGGYNSSLGFQIEREYSPLVNFLPIDLGYLIVLGIIIGCLAELYCRYVLTMQKQGMVWFGNQLILKMTSCGVILGFIYAFLPNEFHHITELKTIIANGEIGIPMALSIFFILFVTTGLAAASGAPGGLFYPMLILGGSMGLACGNFVEIVTGHVPSTYVFAGMGAFVAACSHTPVTAMFLAFALTKDLLILKPLLVACITSFLVARSFNEHSIYERQIDLDLTKNRKSSRL
ncbi:MULTISPECIES: ClC family H(+)/Cl(-) exchange transporter [Prochlorococcus]|uniref:ClC family H(+)/Cl(-) exchange transporter n=1 Tax=Prochlorococcus TaxID=1218 RepID=UPI0005337D46|nr:MULTISPECIES: ClC family H(+)/Cl(-) exchange transporter [Prochlorococcus]KGG13737.1 Chloride channel protein [Prochlorococcus sp. MIT 0601]